MIAHDSLLRTLPFKLTRQMAFDFGAFRLSTDMAVLSHRRLIESITLIGQDPQRWKELSVAAMSDAMSFTDALDRCRFLWKSITKDARSKPNPTPFPPLAEEFRKIRNINDHVGENSQRIIAGKNAVLGSICWFTATKGDCSEGWLCRLIAGTHLPWTYELKVPDSAKRVYPTSDVKISAGGNEADVAKALAELETVVRLLEDFLGRQSPDKASPFNPGEFFTKIKIGGQGFVSVDMTHAPIPPTDPGAVGA